MTLSILGIKSCDMIKNMFRIVAREYRIDAGVPGILQIYFATFADANIGSDIKVTVNRKYLSPD